MTFCDHVGVILGSFLGSFWGHVGVILDVFGGILKDTLLSSLFLIVFGASLGPTWAQVGLQVGSSWGQNRHLTSIKF